MSPEPAVLGSSKESLCQTGKYQYTIQKLLSEKFVFRCRQVISAALWRFPALISCPAPLCPDGFGRLQDIFCWNHLQMDKMEDPV